MSPQEAQMEDDNLTEASGKSIVTPEKQDDTDSDEQNHAKVTQETYQTDEDQEVQAEASVSEDSMKIVAVTPEKQDGIVDRSDRGDIKLRHASYQDEEDGDYYAEDDHAEDSVETIAVEQQDGVDGDDNIKLMHDSNQTDEERRRIRKTQRLLYTKVVEAGDDLNIDEVRGENNKIFSNVYYPREAVLDGANMKAIVTRAAQKVDRIFKVPRYDADRLVSKLVAKCRGVDGFFDWDAFGTQAGTCYNAMPSNISFLNGSLSYIKEIKVPSRASRVRIRDEEDVEEEEPEEVREHTDRNADQLSAVQNSLKSMQKTLKQTVFRTYHHNKKKLQDLYEGGEIPPRADKKLKKRGVEIDAIRFLFNPASFTQTVENLFHYSFLVKEGVATMRIRKKGIGDNFGIKGAPGGLACHYVEDASSHPANTQAVVSLSMQDWRDLIKAYDIRKGDLPYRTGSTQTKSVDLTQVLDDELSEDDDDEEESSS